MNKNNKSAITVLNWNGKKFLKDCLSAVYEQTEKNFEVYFVDNGSTDGSIEFVKNNFPKTKIVSLDKNYGFAKGTNEGIKEAFKDKKVKYIICLNNDTIVSKNWLKELVNTAQKDNKIGAVCSKSYFKDGKTIQNAGLIYTPAIGINKVGGISLGYGFADKEAPELSKEIEIFAPGGIAPLYRRDVLEKIYQRDGEIFDEDFFAYAEDLDLGFRIRKLGYKSVLSPKATLIHLHSQTGGVASPFKAFYSERNSILTAIKNLSLKDLLLFPLRNIALKISYFFKKHESVESLKKEVGFIKMFLIVIKAHLSAIVLTPKMFVKRAKIKYKK
ncbi:MAG: glycosyltransferase family 2 protein [Patescibacteria group bacterium]|jgi:GT2 family glycosyltransferase